jgi:16S rRNA processing protein RimM
VATSTETGLTPVIIGKIKGIYGVKGGLRIYSYTQPRARIFSYQPWLLHINNSWLSRNVTTHRDLGRALVVFFEGVTEPVQARHLLGAEIAVRREQLPALPAGEYYWCDLIRMELIDTKGQSLGTIIDMRETGANDVMVVRGADEFLVPWVKDKIVKRVDVAAGRVYVDWDPEYQ